jgi:hypothetical protein
MGRIKLIPRIFAALAVLSFLTGTAVAQTCTSYPYTLTNGTTADASQVMANLNYVLNCTNNNQVVPSILRGWLGGLTMSNDATTPFTVIDTSAGIANSDDATTLMTLAAFTKNANGAWAVGTGNGCLDSGSSLAASTWYHLFVITRTDTGVVDELCSTSATGPTLPTSYTKKRRIGSFLTDGSAHVIPFTQLGDEFLWKTAVNNASGGTAGSSARSLVTLTVPSGVQVTAIAMVEIGSAAGVSTAFFTSPDQNDFAQVGGTADLYTNGASQWSAARFNIRTSTSSQIGIRGSTASFSYYINTVGWIDSRGRFQ